MASASSEKKKIGIISQMEVAMTTFGFAGFALIRPHVFGINRKDRGKREGFLHFWAVLNYMLGVRDEFNICLLPMEAAEIEFDVIMRNVLSPYLQVESALLKTMLTALIDGLRPFMPLLDYDSQMFLTRRAVGIPGYQYNIKLKQEKPHRSLFTEEELKQLGHPLFRNSNILLIKVREKRNEELSSDSIRNRYDVDSEYMKAIRKEFELDETQTLRIKEVSRNGTEFMRALNAKKYNQLSGRSKLFVNMNLSFIAGLQNRMTNFVLEQILTHQLNTMRSQQKTRREKK